MKKILIIEDDLDIQELIQFFLEDQGYEVITASDGIDGIAVFLKEQIDLIRLEQQEQENTGTYIDGYIAPDLKIQDVEVHITKEMVLMDIGMISGILIIAVLVAGITIMKKRPKQILSEMS